MTSFLTYDTGHRAVRSFFIRFPIQRNTDGKPHWGVVSDYMNAAHRFTARPLSDGFQTIFSENPVANADCSEFHHFKKLRSKKACSAGQMQGPKVFGAITQATINPLEG
jgi:hypothetical protein